MTMKPTIQQSEDERETTEAVAEGFLRAGGSLSWPEWCAMPILSRAAFIVSADRLAAERAAMAGTAAQSPGSAAEIMAASDGGDMAVSVAIDGEVERLRRAAAKGRL